VRNGKYFKLARPDGWDFYTGKTINYRENIGQTVKCPNKRNENPDIWQTHAEFCSPTVLHASKNLNDCFVGAQIPCSVYTVYGKPVIESKEKCGFKEFKVLEEIPEVMFDRLFGWNYSEARRGVDLLRQGLIPSYDGETWRLHAGPECKVVFKLDLEAVKT
jgi:hypothetical protein